MNKVANAINAKRVAMDKDVKASISEADGVLNGLRDRLKAVYDSTGKQIAQAEEWWLSCRIELLQAEYEGVAPDLAQLVPLGDLDPEHIITPGIFVQRVFSLENLTAAQRA